MLVKGATGSQPVSLNELKIYTPGISEIYDIPIDTWQQLRSKMQISQILAFTPCAERVIHQKLKSSLHAPDKDAIMCHNRAGIRPILPAALARIWAYSGICWFNGSGRFVLFTVQTHFIIGIIHCIISTILCETGWVDGTPTSEVNPVSMR